MAPEIKGKPGVIPVQMKKLPHCCFCGDEVDF